jgi:hypothetical protein
MRHPQSALQYICVEITIYIKFNMFPIADSQFTFYRVIIVLLSPLHITAIRLQ